MNKLILVLILLALPAAAAARTWQVVPDKSTLTFTGEYQNAPFKGEFRHFQADIAYDPANLASAKFDVTVTLGSVDTQSDERDQTLEGSDFFATKTYPKAHFVTRSFERGGDGKVIAHGSLDLHGKQHPVDLDVDFNQQGDGAVLEVSTTLNRLDYDLGASEDWSDITRQIPVHAHLTLR
ncbi:MAG: YceI family protein [Rhodanobacteraceae bacterium]